MTCKKKSFFLYSTSNSTSVSTFVGFATFRFAIFSVAILILTFCTACENEQHEKTLTDTSSEYIWRKSDDIKLCYTTPEAKKVIEYPWKDYEGKSLRPISKEYFRCKGMSLNPPRVMQENGKETARYLDCGGAEKHSLPIRNNKEYIYPILIELLNHIQTITKKQVIITSGHRCPTHNTYVDPSPQNLASKHMLGAEVNFYVQGLENQPEAIVKILMDYYKTHTRYLLLKDYQEFKRFEKNTTTSILPWYNKEIFIKLFQASEGRNIDNRHAHPYVSIQVRFDRERNVGLNFSWEQAQQFLRK